MNGCVVGWMGEMLYGWMVVKMDGLMDEWIGRERGWMDGLTNGSGAWMDGWMNG